MQIFTFAIFRKIYSSYLFIYFYDFNFMKSTFFFFGITHQVMFWNLLIQFFSPIHSLNLNVIFFDKEIVALNIRTRFIFFW